MGKRISSFRSKIIVGAALLAAMATLAGNANATAIYNGAVFDLSLDSQIGTTYTFTYSADFTNWDAAAQPNQQYMAAANFKPNTGAVPTGTSLVSTNAPGSWTVLLGNANNNGCDGTGAQSFICALSNPLAAASTTTGATYDWTFSVTYASALSADAFSGAPIRAWFVDSSGSGTGLMSMSTDITHTVPEPGPIALLGAGLLALGITGRRARRRQKSA